METTEREALDICRRNLCGCYEDEDRCAMLGRPCQLAAQLRGGFRCPLGFHKKIFRESDDESDER